MRYMWLIAAIVLLLLYLALGTDYVRDLLNTVSASLRGFAEAIGLPGQANLVAPKLSDSQWNNIQRAAGVLGLIVGGIQIIIWIWKFLFEKPR